MVGKYEVVRKLAMGGMAEIYLARVRGSGGFEKLVVVKRILPTVADDPKFVRMFLDEALLASTLRHPNIADVYEVGEHEGSPFFAMEFVHGQDVRSIRFAVRERKEHIPLAIALAIVHGTASALDYAHDRTGPDGKNLGLVHRDVSSSNILVSYEGAIKLIDFGIARATSSRHDTKTGSFKGKIPYMAPEQCRGQATDRRSDLFALGVVMYELTAGRRPFHGENDFAILDQIVNFDAPPPSSMLRNYPDELEAIVMRLLARRPEDRYQTAEDMLRDLDPFLAKHQLWVSPKPLSKYMRMLFGDRIGAIDRALEEGMPLTATGPSARSELLTPPSQFPALVPLSVEMPALRASSDLPLATATEEPAEARDADVPSASFKYPTLERRSSARIVLGIFGVLALGVGGYVAFTAIQRDAESMAPLVPPPPPPVAPTPAALPDAMPVEAATPDAQEPPAPAPEPTAPAIKPKPKRKHSPSAATRP